jgi:DNA mismatch repair ATPase MutS
LQKEGKQFQPVDIELFPKPCLITGANMSGKTIFLRTVAFTQYMFQFGFFVPAKHAEINMVEEVLFCSEEGNSELSGLSSFAYEILKLNHFIKQVKNGRKVLILVDEPARTTNPTEGCALVSAFMTIMVKYNALALVTTHYAGVHSRCRRLRVKVLELENNTAEITPQHINQYMNYQLIETGDDQVPHEALRIAEIFEVDEEFLQLSHQRFDCNI